MSRSPWIGLVRQVAARAGLGLAALTCGATAAFAQAGAPPTGDSPARFCPKDGHLLFVEFDGLDAHAEAWKKTAAYKILNDTPTGAMLEDLFQQVYGFYLTKPTGLSGSEALQLLKHFARAGFLIDVATDPADPNSGQLTIVLRDAFGNKDVRPVVARLLQKMASAGSKSQAVVVSGHKLISVPTKANKEGVFFWWVEEARKKDIILINPSKGQMEPALEVVDGKKPSALDNPEYAELARSMRGAERTGMILIDPASVRAGIPAPQLKQFDALGLDRIDFTFGFQGEAMLTTTRLHSRAAEAQGDGAVAKAMGEVSGPGFDKGSIAAIPAGVVNFGVVSLDPKKLVDHAPQIQDQFSQMVASYSEKSKLRLREDVLAHLGPKFLAYSMPSKATAATGTGLPNALGMLVRPGGAAALPKFALVADVSNPAAFGKNLDELMSLVNRAIKAKFTPPPVPGAPAAPRGRGPGGPPAPEFRVMPGEAKSYVLNVPSELATSFPAGFRPTIRLGAKQVAIAPSADVARQALEVKGSYAPPPEVAEAYNKLPAKLKFLMMLDPRDSTPEVLAALPGKLQAGLRTTIQGGMPAPAGSGFSEVPRADAPPPGATPPPEAMPGARRGRPRGPMVEEVEEVADPSPPAPPEPPQAQGPDAGPLPKIEVDPAKLPSADAIRGLLFPTLVTVDQESGVVRVTIRAAFPFIPDPSIVGPAAVAGYKAGSAAARARAGGPPIPPPPPATPPAR